MKQPSDENSKRRRLQFEPLRPRSTYHGPPITESDLRSALKRYNIKVVDDETAEKADYVLCMPDGQAEYFTDDVHTLCFFCLRPIHHRPHVPKRPKKICIDCAGRMPEEPN
jgi:hypothetical protein